MEVIETDEIEIESYPWGCIFRFRAPLLSRFPETLTPPPVRFSSMPSVMGGVDFFWNNPLHVLREEDGQQEDINSWVYWRGSKERWNGKWQRTNWQLRGWWKWGGYCPSRIQLPEFRLRAWHDFWRTEISYSVNESDKIWLVLQRDSEEEEFYGFDWVCKQLIFIKCNVIHW